MTVFETDRLIVRPWALDDAPALFAIFGDRAVTRWIDVPVHADVDASRRSLERRIAQGADSTPSGRGWWAVVERATGTPIGNGGVHPVFDGAATEVGYHIGRAHWGRGFATEYAHGAIAYALRTLGLERVIATTIPTNLASQRVMQRVGMQRVADVDFQGYWSACYEARAATWRP